MSSYLTNSSSSLFPPPLPVLEGIGIIDENGVMVDDFKVGDFDPKLTHEMLANLSNKNERREDENKVKAVEKFKMCDESMKDFIPCLDNVDAIRQLISSEKGEKFERHCPEMGKSLDCLIPAPKGYQSSIPWPQSRDEVIQILLYMI